MKIGIIGLGLIGGSLAKDFREENLEIYGVSRQEETCINAQKRGIVDYASKDLSLIYQTDLIFICTPIAKIIPTLAAIVPHLKPETIVTDVGSVKAPLVKTCSELWTNFIGGHPMAGTAEKGLDAAQKQLFKNAPYVITPTETTPIQAIQTLENLVKKLQSVIYFASPEEHDQAVALISHLPVMISASLIKTVMGETNTQVLELAQKIASSGFKDTSRVGGGNPELGLMMAQYNRENLKQSLLDYRQILDQIINHLEQENWQALESILDFTQNSRPKFL
jgi:arogenate dehydrogenase (NADP+)